MRTDDPRHGTHPGYRAGCRCQPCKRANTRYSEQRRLDILNGKPYTLPTTGTRRRIEALQWMSWSLQDIADAAGWRTEQAVHRITRRKRVSPETARRVADVYERLCMTHGPSPVARRRALAAGYASPLSWDDIDRDETPNGGATSDLPDPVVVERILAGDHTLTATKAERWEVIERWPGSDNELERRTGWNVARDRREMRAENGGENAA